MLLRVSAKEGKQMAFEGLKSKQSVMWGNGPYQNITETLTDLHELVIDRLAPAVGVTWLDLACGTGAMAELATKGGADVMGIDLAPALIETAKERAQEQGLDIDYRVGDCENLEVPDASFDVVSSTCGVMSRPTTRPRRKSWRGSSSRAGGSGSRTGPPKAAWRRCSR
jgi:2-polyprenyl-3-methyl-5-hydroxy-6-metoxy-1,4-benzoquinol methylase